jgi:peptidoglycan/xylan/chitin deacetylase (PgdA/CDA1 family)
MKFSKRDLAAKFAMRCRLTTLLGLLPSRTVLLVLTYHRIGNASECPYDSDVFSATADELDGQVRFFKRNWGVVGLDEAIEIVEGKKKPKGAAVLLTFDDGYLDNYELAVPILATHRVQGVFFLPTAYIGTDRIPWWDAIAFIIKNSRRSNFELNYPSPRRFDVAAEGEQKVIRQVLGLYKSTVIENSECFIAALEEACDAARPGGMQRLFMNWEEAAKMVAKGMAVGSHTNRHEILSKLSAEEQNDELASSKAILERRLVVPVRSLAYPVGLRGTFSSDTLAAAERAQYSIAFSFYGGVNIAGEIERYDVRRIPVDYGAVERLQLETTLSAITGKYWA